MGKWLDIRRMTYLPLLLHPSLLALSIHSKTEHVKIADDTAFAGRVV